ncbi:MAG: DUF4142 domain-containing protein [Candidatus Eremiobacteraeota bacterium]|nr:DUF4142 domain-containing protein [Candidatus Eremiobacteraeota bacterium]MBV9971872.1 DUF4142 domain-containing protein [Candidatus Eremiobacteraeota bacterium]
MNRKLQAFSLGIVLAAGATAAGLHAQPNPAEHNDADRAFVTDAINAGDMEIAQARAELSNGDPRIVQYARLMITDHVAANTHLGQLAELKGIPYPKTNLNVTETGNTSQNTTPDQASSTTTPVLSAGAYMQKEVTDHQNTIALFQKQAQNGVDRDIKVFVGNTLPTLQAHLQMAQDYLAGRPMTMPSPVPPALNNAQPATPTP